MLNGNGGRVVIHLDTDSSIPVEGIPFARMSLVIRILEQSMISVIGLHQTVSKLVFTNDKDSIFILINKADSLITINFNLYLPSQTQVVEVSPLESLERVEKDILCRKVIVNPVLLGSHCQIFLKGEECSNLLESKVCQFKNLRSDSSKRTTLADRMTSKGNKFTCYVSAFANHSGGHIYYGITSDKDVTGEFIENKKNHIEIIRKVEKAINKMVWPEQIGQPKRGEQWEIFFEPVLDENYEPIPSTFVIVVYIAPCLGGVFTEEPECYEMMEGKVKKMSFITWKKRISQPVWLRGKDEIPPLVPRTTWTSAAARNAFTDAGEKLRQLISNGDWDTIFKTCATLEKTTDQPEMKLVVLSRKATACYRRGNFEDAYAFLQKYKDILPQVEDIMIFEVIGMHLEASLKRATGDLEGLEGPLTQALSKAELIEPGVVTATVYVFAASVTDLINLEDSKCKFSPDALSILALDHSQYVENSSRFSADMEQKAHITLATFHLGFNLCGRDMKKNVDKSSLEKAKTSIMEVHHSTYEGRPLSRYREVQLHLAQSIYYYRSSQVYPDEKTYFLQSGFHCAKKAENLAEDYEFREMLDWSKLNKDFCEKEFAKDVKNRRPETNAF